MTLLLSRMDLGGGYMVKKMIEQVEYIDLFTGGLVKKHKR